MMGLREAFRAAPVTMGWIAMNVIVAILVQTCVHMKDLLIFGPNIFRFNFANFRCLLLAPFCIGPWRVILSINGLWIATHFRYFFKFEKNHFQGVPRKLVLMVFSAYFLIIMFDVILNAHCPAYSLYIAFIYIYSKLYPNEGRRDIPLQWAPLGMVFLSLINNSDINSTKDQVIGLFAGHIVFYRRYVYPVVFGNSPALNVNHSVARILLRVGRVLTVLGLAFILALGIVSKYL